MENNDTSAEGSITKQAPKSFLNQAQEGEIMWVILVNQKEAALLGHLNSTGPK